jgi:CheY-like chemotaxis protein
MMHASPAEGRPRILVIDDEALIGAVVKRMLAAEYDVTPVTSAAEGLRLLAEAPAFDLVLCDLMMPDMNGMQVHAQLEVSLPHVAATMVFLTGGAFTGQARDFLDRVPNLCLEKPFDSAKLRNVVHDLAPPRASLPPRSF